MAWCSTFLRQPDGPDAGQRWSFTESQRRFLLWFYAVDESGRWLYRRAALRWAKGRGKSPMLAALCLAELCGPVVYAGPCEPVESDPLTWGGCVGASSPMPWVQIAATAEWQTVNTMSLVLAMAPKQSKLVKRYGLDVGKTVIYRPGGGRLEVISASARAAEGNRPTSVALEEPQEWFGSNGGKALAETIRRNLAKTGGRSVEAGNAHVPGAESVSESTWEAWQAQQEGRSKSTGILYDALEAPPDTDLADEASLRAGLAVAYTDAAWQDLDRIVGEVWDPSTPPDKSRRYYLNQIVAAEDAWVAPAEWAACADPSIVLADGDDVAMFFDGSKSRDATALVGCRLDDGFVFTVGVWEPDPNDMASQVDVGAVELAVAQAFDRWQVRAFFADVREWEGQVLTDWPTRYGDDLVLWASPSSRPAQPIGWDMRSHNYDFTRAAEECASEIAAGRLAHDGDLRTARHVGNARRALNRYGVSVRKESPASPRKIDAAVCVIGARMVRRMALGSKDWQRRQRRSTGRGRVVVLA
jgi:hypothetical protein